MHVQVHEARDIIRQSRIKEKEHSSHEKRDTDLGPSTTQEETQLPIRS
jgi:hypothetical protein